jgi:uridine kinase
MSIFVDVSAEEALRRALVRDVTVLGGPDAEPELVADVVIDNDDPAQPTVVKWSV